MSNLHPSHIQALTDFITDETTQPNTKKVDYEKQQQQSDKDLTYQTSQIQKSQSLLTPQFKQQPDSKICQSISAFKKWRKTIFVGIIIGFVLVLFYMIYRKKKQREVSNQMQQQLELQNHRNIQQENYKEKPKDCVQSDSQKCDIQDKQKQIDQKQKILEQLRNKVSHKPDNEQTKQSNQHQSSPQTKSLNNIPEQSDEEESDEESLLLKPSCKQDKTMLNQAQTYDQQTDSIVVLQSPPQKFDEQQNGVMGAIEVDSDLEDQE